MQRLHVLDEDLTDLILSGMHSAFMVKEKHGLSPLLFL